MFPFASRSPTILLLLAMLVSPLLSLARAESSPHVLIVVTSHAELGDTGKPTGYYLSEVAHPTIEFVRAGYEVDFVSPKGGNPPVDPGSVDKSDPVNVQFLNDPRLIDKLNRSLSPAQVDPTIYAAVVFAGGHGTMWDFPENSALNEIARTVYQDGGVVAAVCHGPAALVNVTLDDGSYLVAGKSVTSFTDSEEHEVKLNTVVPFSLQQRLRERGAEFVAAPQFTENIQSSGRLVTGQNPASARKLAIRVIDIVEQRGNPR